MSLAVAWEPLRTFPSGSSAKSSTSESSTLPNLPMSPCSLRPVKVRAMRQKRMWPVPEVVRRLGSSGLKATCKHAQWTGEKGESFLAEPLGCAVGRSWHLENVLPKGLGVELDALALPVPDGQNIVRSWLHETNVALTGGGGGADSRGKGH